MNKKGEITVFLTLMITVLAAFVTALSKNAQKSVAKSEAAYAADSAVRSCFAEYNRVLYEKTGILLIDSSYRTNEGGIDRIADHFSMYLSDSLVVNELVDVTVEGEPAGYEVFEEYDDISDITEYMRANGSPGFDPDECYDSLEFTAVFDSPATGPYTITREYSYDPSKV